MGVGCADGEGVEGVDCAEAAVFGCGETEGTGCGGCGSGDAPDDCGRHSRRRSSTASAASDASAGRAGRARIVAGAAVPNLGGQPEARNGDAGRALKADAMPARER
jgi:hypothetical protein